MQNQCCSHALPRVVDEVAKNEPDRIWMTIPRASSLDSGWRDITFSELGHAVNGFARWIEKTFGRGNGNEAMAYIGINDQLYAVVIVGMMKAGYQALLLSTRNSPDGQASLLDQTKCKALLHSSGVDQFVSNIDIAVPDITKCLVPTFDELCRQGSEAGFYSGQYDDSEIGRALILHTSGSTGLPRAINIANGAVASVVYLPSLLSDDGRQNCPGNLLSSAEPVFTMVPFFHAMGLLMIARAILCKGRLIALPPGQPPSAELIIKILEAREPWGALIVPSLLEEISSTPRGMNALAKLDKAFYGGAPLRDDVVALLSKHTDLMSVMGSTEALGCPSMIQTDPSDFGYFEWAPKSGLTMDDCGDEMYELVIKRGEEPRVQAVFFSFPEIDEWRTKDLFERHPTKTNLWKYKCRKDDVLVLKNGEKFNPNSFEHMVEAGPFVKSALVVGAGRFQTALLVEPNWKLLPSGCDATALVDMLWPIIERANAESPSHGRIWRSKIAIARENKPFSRAPKGTVTRGSTINLYSEEIDALYLNESAIEHLGTLEKGADLESIIHYLQSATKAAGMSLPDDVSDDADIFSFGVDSLQVLALSSILSNALEGTEKATAITARDVYAHPTLGKLAGLLQRRESGRGEESPSSREQDMEAMIEKYTRDLPPFTQAEDPLVAPDRATVILTGSTGSLGSYLLQELISSPRVAHIYCFNRTADAEVRQERMYAARGTTTSFDKVTFMHTDMGQDDLGLPEQTYSTLLTSVNIVIHNAWAVDFNKTLASYESVHVAGTRRLIDFSTASRYRAEIVFISSIASVGNWLASHSSDELVPERIIAEHTAPSPQGYGESKHVAEMVLATVARKTGTLVTLVRAGQLAGPSDGAGEWNRNEWVPSLVLTSKVMGMLPDRLGDHDEIDWVPVDWAAKSVCELAMGKNKAGQVTVAHLRNPAIASWTALVPEIQEALGGPEKVGLVPYERWVAALEKVSLDKEEVQRHPAVKLMDFFKNLAEPGSAMPGLQVRETSKLSAAVKNMKAIDGSMIKAWVGQWLA